MINGNSIKNLAWYPPAETKIPFRAIFGSLFQSSNHFEEVLCNFLGVEKCVLINSGRALLYLLIEALKRKTGDKRNEVLVPGYTCYSVAASIAKAGLKIRAYDLDPKSLRPTNLDSLKKNASDRTLAIISQHLFGIPSPVEDLRQISKSIGACLIEDAAQALGGTMNGRPLGTMGDFGFFSFGRGKSLPLGAGGALVGREVEIFSEFNLESKNNGYSSLVSTAVTQIMSNSSLYWIPEMLPIGLGETIFDAGFNISAMPLLMQKLAENSMSTLHKLNAHRHHIAMTYMEAFDAICIIPVFGESKSVYTRFPLLAGPGPIPKELIRMGVRRMYPKAIADELTIKPYFAKQHKTTPGASEIARNLITLPTHMGISEVLAQKIARKVKDAFNFRRIYN